MTRLFDLAAEYREAAEKLADLDLPDEVVADTLEGMSGDLTTKATNVAMMVADWTALAASIKDAERRMAERRKAIENRAARVTDFLLNAMLYAGIEKIESPHLRIAVRNNPPAVEIDEPALIPAGFLRDVPPPPPEIDKAAVRAALASGLDVPGARLVQRKRLEVK